jgi:hypothetical protein
MRSGIEQNRVHNALSHVGIDTLKWATLIRDVWSAALTQTAAGRSHPHRDAADHQAMNLIKCTVIVISIDYLWTLQLHLS